MCSCSSRKWILAAVVNWSWNSRNFLQKCFIIIISVLLIQTVGQSDEKLNEKMIISSWWQQSNKELNLFVYLYVFLSRFIWENYNTLFSLLHKEINKLLIYGDKIGCLIKYMMWDIKWAVLQQHDESKIMVNMTNGTMQVANDSSEWIINAYGMYVQTAICIKRLVDINKKKQAKQNEREHQEGNYCQQPTGLPMDKILGIGDWIRGFGDGGRKEEKRCPSKPLISTDFISMICYNYFLNQFNWKKFISNHY